MQTVDPEVSRSKFDREVALFRDMAVAHRRRGILLMEAAFPLVTVAFCAVKLSPPPVFCTVRLDFTDYDLRPPSVRFVDPFTGVELAAKDITVQLLRLPKVDGMTRDLIVALMTQGAQLPPITPIIQAHGPDDPPFICLPGIREYHDNPAHTGDAWLLHRGSGEGSLAFIVEKIWAYGANAAHEFHLQLTSEAEGLKLLTQVQARKLMMAMSPAAMAQ